MIVGRRTSEQNGEKLKGLRHSLAQVVTTIVESSNKLVMAQTGHALRPESFDNGEVRRYRYF